MKHQKKINLLSNITNQPSNYKTKNWVKIIDHRGEAYGAMTKLNVKIQC